MNQAASAPVFSISREFNAPRDLVWEVCSKREHMQHWFGPKGMTYPVARMDFRPGGTYHFCMRADNGFEMWGKFVYQEIVPPEKIVWIHSFSDENGGTTRHPMSPDWPLEMMATLTLTESAGKTTFTVSWLPLNATEAECKVFTEGMQGMHQGWTGTLDQLQAYLPIAAAAQPASDREIVTTRLMDAPRERVFEAWTNPKHLAKWWGPKGFTNTFHEFDARPGGAWRFVMHGPDGTDYQNESEFVEIVKPERVVFDHLRPMHRFHVTATFAEESGQTQVTFRMRFDTVEECNRVKGFVVEANEQNFDRLEAELARMA